MNFTQQRGIYLPIDVRTLLYANLITKATTNQQNYNKVMSYPERSESQRRRNLQTTTTKTTSFQSQRSEPREVKMEMEGSSYRSHDMQAFSRQDHASMTESMQWYSDTNRGIYYSSFKQPSLESKMIGGDRAMTEDWSVMGHPTVSADRDEESSVVVVQREKPAFVTPEWMEERPSPETRCRNPEVLDINILLKYPSSYAPKRNAPDPRKLQYESTIRPEVAKRDNAVPVLPVQKEKPEFVTPEWMEERPSPETKHRNPDVLDINILLTYPSGYVPKRNAPDPRKMQYESTIRPEVAKRDNSAPVLRDEDFEEDDDDEFEEEIIVVDVQRQPLWRKGLAKPKPERPKVGVPIHHLLQLPARRVKQESVPDRFFIDEKVESVQRPPMNYEAVDLKSILEKQ